MKNKTIFLFFILILVLLPLISAQSDFPINMQKIVDFNNQSTMDFSVKITFLIAFLAGILGILSPCILPFLPAYFSYTFKEKKNITKMTLVFFLGFSLVFVAMGVVAGLIGAQVLLRVQKGWLVTIAGFFMVFLGLMTLRGKNICSGMNLKRFKSDIPGVFLFGMFFAIGWTACLGPILAGILGIGAILGNIWYSALLMFFYSLGNLVPLFVLSMFYDKFNLSESKWIQGRVMQFSLGGQRYYVHSTNLISGILFFIIGFILILYKGTSVINSLDIFGTRSYFYSVQRWLIEWPYANVFGLVLLALFIAAVGWFLWNQRIKNNNGKKEH